MHDPICIFRDVTTVEDESNLLLEQGKVKPGQTIVFGGRIMTIDLAAPLLPGCNIILIADSIKVMAGGGSISATPTEENPSPSVTVIARTITTQARSSPWANAGGLHPAHGPHSQFPVNPNVFGTTSPTPLTITSRGLDGKPGTPGKKAVHGVYVGPGTAPASEPVPGGDGQDGFPGGEVVVRYVEADAAPVVSSTGGKGGLRGAGDPATNYGDVAAPAGKKDGVAGAPGHTLSQKLNSAQEIWGIVGGQSWAQGWQEFVCSVALYNFRCYTNQSIITAIEGFLGVLGFNPGLTKAATYLQRALRAQTPDGQSRNVDIAPDFKGLYVGLNDFAAIIQNVLNSVGQLTSGTLLQQSLRSDLKSGMTRTQADLTYAKGSIVLAQADQQYASSRLDEIRTKIQQAIDQNSGFSFTDFVTTVGSIVGALTTIGAGVAAILSIKDSLVAIGDLLNASHSVVEFFKQKDLKKDFTDFGNDVSDIVSMKDGVVNFQKLIRQIGEASSTAGQGPAADLLGQLAEATWQKLTADLRFQQATDYVNGLNDVVATYAAALRDLDHIVHGGLDSAKRLFKQGRCMASQLSEQVFLAARALEIYELDTPLVRFDYGYVHPDDEQDFSNGGDVAVFLGVVASSQSTLNDLPTDLQTWLGIYNWTNSAQGGFNVVHPAYSIAVTDAPGHVISIDDLRTSLMPGHALYFVVDLSELGETIYEAKVDGMQFLLKGARAPTGLLHFVIRHGGAYTLKSRATGTAVSFSLSGREEMCNFAASANPRGLACSIPYMTQPSVEPGPPFSFWGRGVAADWLLFHDDVNFPNETYDVSGLTQVAITIAAVAFKKPSLAPAPPQRLRVQPKRLLLVRNFKPR